MKLNPRAALMSGGSFAGGSNTAQGRRRSCVAFAGVVSSLLALAAVPATAADTGPVQSFVDCLNSIDTSPRPHTVADAVACVPAGCYTTVTMSGESAQPACTLKDGTKLPRVIFSCPGANGSLGGFLQFRPSFSLCTQKGTINHIEVGQDVNKSNRSDDPELRNFPYVQKMADFNAGPSSTSWGFTEFGATANVATAVLDAKSPANSKGCSECHDRLGNMAVSTAVPPGIANLFGPIPPAVAEGTIFTNDPAVDGFGSLNTNPFADICAGIQSSTQLAHSSIPGLQNLAYNLCTALQSKTH